MKHTIEIKETVNDKEVITRYLAFSPNLEKSWEIVDHLLVNYSESFINIILEQSLKDFDRSVVAESFIKLLQKKGIAREFTETILIPEQVSDMDGKPLDFAKIVDEKGIFHLIRIAQKVVAVLYTGFF